ncbi:MAG TPA: DJ-1/PfpI family protein [Chloroflexota bacterium]|nr:DJ-1/PfpI family protein [Chloroflexota bacterium]
MQPDPTKPLSIGLVLYPGFTQLDLSGPYEVFSRLPETDVHLIAETAGAIASEKGLAIVADTTFDSAPPLDVLCVPGGPGQLAMMEHAPLIHFLQERGPAARYVTAVCTGALLLGAAGLLRGYRATTHWLSLDLLIPLGAIPVNERVVIDRSRITGGGVTAGIDFGLVLAAELRGEAVAREIQLLIEYDPAPPFTGGHPRIADPDLVGRVTRARGEFQEQRRLQAERIGAELIRGGSAGGAVTTS